jgi:hypothetical protein
VDYGPSRKFCLPLQYCPLISFLPNFHISIAIAIAVAVVVATCIEVPNSAHMERRIPMELLAHMECLRIATAQVLSRMALMIGPVVSVVEMVTLYLLQN